MSMVIRCANFHDLEHITKVFVESWQSTYAGILSKSFLINLSGYGPKNFWQRIWDISEIRPEFFASLSVSGRKKGGVKKILPKK